MFKFFIKYVIIFSVMTIFDENLILETINMIKLHNFDIRTVTLTISLRDCLSEDVNMSATKLNTNLINMQAILLNMRMILKMIIPYLLLTKE